MKFRMHHRPEPEDLLLTPMLDLFIALIPFLLVSAAFVRLGGVKVNVPQSQTVANQKENQEAKEKVSLTFELTAKEIHISAYQDSFSQPVKSLEVKLDISDLKGLSDYLASIKGKHKFGSALFHASKDTPYDHAVQVLDIIHSVPEISTETVLAVGMVN